MTTMNTMMGHSGNQLAGGLAGDRPATMRRVVYTVRDKVTPDGTTKSFWTKIGAAFENRDGSLTVRLDALPLDGSLQIREDTRDRDRPVSAPF